VVGVVGVAVVEIVVEDTITEAMFESAEQLVA
jgi:hypothetical protein